MWVEHLLNPAATSLEERHPKINHDYIPESPVVDMFIYVLAC